MSNVLLKKPTEYNEIEAQQPDTTIFAEDINQIIRNVEVVKGGASAEPPVSNIKELKERADELDNKLYNETNNRINSDESLQAQINTLNSNLTEEVSNRENGDNTLQTQIDTLDSQVEALKEEDTTIKSEISNLTQSITLEMQNRKEEDTGLQNQINDLDHTKQNKLIAGHNVEVQDTLITLKGGVSKNYVVGDEYRVNDFIFHDNRLYRVNRIFTATEWDTDKSYLTLVSANDVATVATEVAYDNGTSGLKAKNLQKVIDEILLERINIETLINFICPIGCYYFQLANDNGIFLEDEAPENLYTNTIWELKYANESIFLRTEGSLSEEGRSNGFQGDAGRNATFSLTNTRFDTVLHSNGVSTTRNSGSTKLQLGTGGSKDIDVNLSRAYITANEFRTRNRLIRIYKRIA